MNIEEAKLYLEHTSKDDFNLEEHQKENRYQAIQVVLKEIERLKKEIKGYEQERERVLNIIDERNHKAIEYIDRHAYSNISNSYDELYNGQIEELLNILKGVDKE